MKRLCPNKIYVFSLCAVCIFNFISFSIQFWVSDHLKSVMKFDEDQITVVFIITCVTAPLSGVILGGYIVGKIGGYVNKKAILFCVIASLFAGIDSILIVFQDSLLGFAIVLWIFLFFGGATIPNLLGE
jgi:CBS domain containing-hemolysin-like protein